MSKKEIKLPEWLKELLPLFNKYSKDKVSIYATQAAFYFIVSAVPFLIFLLSLLRFFIPVTETEFLNLISETIPNSLQYWIYTILADIYTDSTVSLTSFAMITTLWAASKSTYALSLGLVEIYECGYLTNNIKNRVYSLLFTFVLVLMLIGTLLLVVFSKPLMLLIQSYIPLRIEWLIDILKLSDILSLMVICLIFTVMYKVLSYAKISLSEHLPGAIISSLGWLGFSWIFEIYVNNFSKFNVTYGSLASIVIMMLWLQSCMTIFLFGGEINIYLKKRKENK